jgi:glycerol-3-phosphate acyltransferase PlsY
LLQLIGALVFGYLVGSIPTGVLVGQAHRGIDIREGGSGSSGGTNAARLLGWGPGALVIALDVLKGYLAARAGAWLAGVDGPLEPGEVAALAGLCAVLGHVFPLFASLRGGKGVAAAAGVLLAVSPTAMGIAFASFAVLLAVSRIVSVASIGASVVLFGVLAILRWVVGREVPDSLLMLSLALSLVVALAHRGNLARLISGAEPTQGRSAPGRNGSNPP